MRASFFKRVRNNQSQVPLPAEKAPTKKAPTKKAGDA